MIGTEPERGSVIRYAYLWADESARGHEEGRKDRPALVLALSIKAADAVAFPQDIKRRLGLDDLPSWIVTTEANAFIWPGPDVRPVPDRTPRTVIYGKVPDGLLRQVARFCLNGPVGMDLDMQLELMEVALDELGTQPDLVNQVLEVTLENEADAEMRVVRYALPAGE